MVKEIMLTRGKVALVDDDDYGRLAAFLWRAVKSREHAFYAVRYRTSAERAQKAPDVSLRQMQREVLDPEMLVSTRRKVDHRNRNPLDCRKENLRWATDVISNINRKLFKNNTTGYRGVFLAKGGYRVQIRFEGIRHSGGYHSAIEDAARAYNSLALMYHGADAQFNDVPEPKFHPKVLSGEMGIVGPCQINAAKTHCIRGHPFSGDNLRRSPEGWRICVACSRLSHKRKGSDDNGL